MQCVANYGLYRLPAGVTALEPTESPAKGAGRRSWLVTDVEKWAITRCPTLWVSLTIYLPNPNPIVSIY